VADAHVCAPAGVRQMWDINARDRTRWIL